MGGWGFGDLMPTGDFSYFKDTSHSFLSLPSRRLIEWANQAKTQEFLTFLAHWPPLVFYSVQRQMG